MVFDVVQSAALQCVGIHGQLTFDAAINTKLWVGEVMVYSDGDLQIGTTSQPIPANVSAEIVIANKSLNTQTDPDQYGTAFLSWGSVTIHGAPKQRTVRPDRRGTKGWPDDHRGRTAGDGLACRRPTRRPRHAPFEVERGHQLGSHVAPVGGADATERVGEQDARSLSRARCNLIISAPVMPPGPSRSCRM